MAEKGITQFISLQNPNIDSSARSATSTSTKCIDSIVESEISLDAIDNKFNNNCLMKDDDSQSSGSTITTNTEQQQIENNNNIRNDLNNDNIIYLETPIIEENNICLNHDFVDNIAKPKRLSDEFINNEDDDSKNNSKKLIEINNTNNNNNNIESELENISNNNNNDTNSELDINKNLPSTSTFDKTNDNSKILNLMENQNTSNSNISCNSSNSSSTESTANFYYNDNDVQSMDAIERRDFEHEQRLTGGIILRSRSLINQENDINLDVTDSYQNGERAVSSDSKFVMSQRKHTTTPTSSRNGVMRLSKSTAKMNLSTTLDNNNTKKTSKLLKDEYNGKIGSKLKQQPSTSKTSQLSSTFSSSSSSQFTKVDKKKYESTLTGTSNSNNTNDNLIAEKLSDNNIVIKNDKNILEILDINDSDDLDELNGNSQDDGPSTSKTYAKKISVNSKEIDNKFTKTSSSTKIINKLDSLEKGPSTSTFKVINDKDSTKNLVVNNLSDMNERNNQIFEANDTQTLHLPEHKEFDDETWADCEENYEEEICTCQQQTSSAFLDRDSEDEMLPSKHIDLSSYMQNYSISEEIFLPQDQNCVTTTPETGIQRKRKLNSSSIDIRNCDSDSPYTIGDHNLVISRKRMAYDYSSTPRSSQSYASPSTFERRTPRALIPTKDNPPPELQDWLVQFKQWSHVERLLAVDRLIEICEPTQVRHMMKVIEPQFQRDFISLLPRELALQVLSYLEPKDLLRAAQTCRSWRFLCDDNLLWKDKCKEAQILIETNSDKPKRGRAGNMPPILSPWKAAFMRQHIIEMNWRSRPIRDPKILKGHDDHVITCLQFQGNRIVSGSDDNTLKVWSAVSGKCLRTLVGHTGGVWSSQMSGNIIISGSTDRTLKVWDMEMGQCIHTLLGHTSTVRCMHLHGKKVVSGSRDATLRVWDIEKGTCLHVLVGHLAAVRCVQYDGKLIVSGAYDYTVKIWHPERQECLHTLQGHTNRVYSLQFDGIHVVSGSLDTSIRVWDAETGNAKHTLMGHQSLTSGMELRQNILVSGNADSTVKVWDITTGQCLQTLSGPNKHQSAVTCLQFNSRFVITSSDDGTVKLWDVKTGEFIRNLVALDSGGSGGVVWRIRANDTKLICAVGSRNGTEETKLMVLDFDVEGACVKCS